MKETFEIFLLLFFLGGHVASALTGNETVLPDPHLTIIGSTGTGKSSLGNVLLGFPPDCENCTFPVCPDHKSCTKETTYGIGNWTGLPNHVFTAVDTPGYGDTENNDNKLMDDMIAALKENITTTNGFLLVFKGTDERFDQQCQQMLREMEAMFGEGFWEFTTIGVSFWAYDINSQNQRNHSGQDESWYCREKNAGLQEHFDIPFNLTCVFIDSWAKQEWNLDDPYQQEAFDRESSKLWDIVNNTNPFEFKSLQDILEELEAEKEENKHLKEVIDSNITALWKAVDQNSGDIFQNMMSIDENAERIVDVDSTLNEFSSSLNETSKELSQAINENKVSIQQEVNDRQDNENALSDRIEKEEVERFDEDTKIKGELQTELEQEKTSRESADNQISGEISGVDDRVQILENTADQSCSVDSDCGEILNFCIDGWCSFIECQPMDDSTCPGSDRYCEVSGNCISYSYQASCQCNSDLIIGDNTFDTLDAAISGCNREYSCKCIGVNEYSGKYGSHYWLHKSTATSGSAFGDCWIKQ